MVHSLRAKALLGLSGLLLVSCIVLLTLLLDRQAEVDSSVREDAVWAVYQLDRETVKLDAALSDYLAGADTAKGRGSGTYGMTSCTAAQHCSGAASLPRSSPSFRKTPRALTGIVDRIERLAPSVETA